MALLGSRNEIETDITNKSTTVASPGVGLCFTASGSGVTIGDSSSSVGQVANPSGQQFAGLLLHEIASINEALFHRNWNKEQMLVGERCTLGKKGQWYTDQVTGTPAKGNTAYLTTNGQFTPTVSATGGLAATPKCGQFLGSKDANGFVGIDFNLPIV